MLCKVRTFIFFLLVLVLKANIAISQSPYFKLIVFNRENPNIKLNTLFKDHEGFLYYGTSEGLYKSDGIDDVLLVSGKGNDEITAIGEDVTGRIWVGCRFGKVFTIFNGRIEFPFKNKPTENNIISISCLKDSTVLLGTSGNGIIVFNNGSVSAINTKSGLPDDYVYSIVNDKSGLIWAGTDNGIGVLNGSFKTGFKVERLLNSELPDNIIRKLFVDDKNRVWAGTQDEGAFLIDINTFKVSIPAVFKNWHYGQINSILTHNNDVWIGTEYFGIVNLNLASNKQLKRYNSNNGEIFSTIRDLIYDDEGNIWMATNIGLMRTHGNWLSFLKRGNGQALNNIHSIICDSKNQIWFTPDMQLMNYNPEADSSVAFKKYVVTSKNKHVNIVTMREDKYGYIWMGTLGEGVIRFDPITKKRQHITGSPEINKASVLALEIVNDTLWIATYGGVLRCALDADYDMRDELKLRFEDFKQQPELGNFYINDIFIDSKKRIWFGTDGKGLSCYAGYQFKSYNESNGLKTQTIYSITEDKSGNIWFSTLADGVFKFDGKTFQNFSAADGLRENTIPSITSDTSGRIIMIHRRGFDIINTSTGVFEYYGAENNLADINADLNAVAKDDKGNFWIGTEKGIVVFNPNYLHKQKGAKIILRNVLKNGAPFDYRNVNNFSYDQYSFTFDFAGLWFTDAYLVKYQYMLEGFNRNWISTKDKSITFPNLPPGTYTFKVRASLNQKFTNASMASYKFTIQKPFWRESWFVVLCVAGVLALGYFYVQGRDMRIKRLQVLENEKINFQLETLKSQVNPHFLFNSFNTLISIIEKNQDDAVEYVESLSQFFRSMVFYRDKDLITLDEEFQITDAYYFLQQKRYKDNLVIDIIATEEEKKKFCVAPLTLQMLVENAVKHNAVSKETPLYINIGIENDRLKVKNNINAKLKKETSSGLGLQNISSRYKLISHKDITIENNGTYFIVTIPLIHTS